MKVGPDVIPVEQWVLDAMQEIMSMKVETDTQTLSPWSEVNRVLANMKTLEVKVGKKSHTGAISMEEDGSGHVTISFRGGKNGRSKS